MLRVVFRMAGALFLWAICQELPAGQVEPQEQAPPTDPSQSTVNPQDEEQEVVPGLPPVVQKSPGLLPLQVIADIEPAEYPIMPVVFSEGILVVVGEGGVAEAFAVDTGEFLWKLGLPGKNLHPPVVTPNGLLFALADGALMMVEPETGKILDEKKTPSPIDLRPVIEGDVVFLADSSGRVVAFDHVTGLEIWRADTREPIQALTTGGELLVASGAGGTLTAIELPDGKIRWKFIGQGTFESPVSFDPDVERIYVGDSAGVFYCLNSDKGNRRFKWETGASIFGRPLIDRDRLFVVNYGNTLYCYRRDNGHLLWLSNFNGRPASGPLRVNARIIVPIRDGLLLELDPSAQGRSRQPPHPIGSEIRSPPSFELPYVAFALRSGHVLLMKTGAPPTPLPPATVPPTEVVKDD